MSHISNFYHEIMIEQSPTNVHTVLVFTKQTTAEEAKTKKTWGLYFRDWFEFQIKWVIVFAVYIKENPLIIPSTLASSTVDTQWKKVKLNWTNERN